MTEANIKQLDNKNVKELNVKNARPYPVENELLDRMESLIREYDGITNISVIGIMELAKSNYMNR